MHGESGFLMAEKPLENAYLGSRLCGGITYSLFVEVLLKIPINLFCLVHVCYPPFVIVSSLTVKSFLFTGFRRRDVPFST